MKRFFRRDQKTPPEEGLNSEHDDRPMGIYIDLPVFRSSPLLFVLFIVFVLLPILIGFFWSWFLLIQFWSDQIAIQVSTFGIKSEVKNSTESISNVTSPVQFDEAFDGMTQNETIKLIEKLVNEGDITQKTCDEGHFYCDTSPPWKQKRQMFAWTKRCDGHPDCWDRSDERNCTRCLTSFQCKHEDGKHLICLRGEKLCDQVKDCPDGSDETMYCHRTKACEHDEFKCYSSKTNLCYPNRFKCDGEHHCPYGEDEYGCNEKCAETARHCASAQNCIPIWKMCTGTSECLDHSDEKFVSDCSNKGEPCPGQCVKKGYSDTASESTTTNYFNRWTERMYGHNRNIHCNDGKWYHPIYACNGHHPQCDEHCSVCTPQAFQCANKKQCIPKNKLHDGVNDCEDKSDECDCTPAIPCTSELRRCDGYADCEGGSDEANCTSCLSKNEHLFHRYYWEREEQQKYEKGESNYWLKHLEEAFLCQDDEKCITLEQRCDGRKDCSSGKDEENCSCAECLMHPQRMYICRNNSRCFRYDEVCDEKFVTRCPEPHEIDEGYCRMLKMKYGGDVEEETTEAPGVEEEATDVVTTDTTIPSTASSTDITVSTTSSTTKPEETLPKIVPISHPQIAITIGHNRN